MSALKENYKSLAAAVLHQAVDDHNEPKYQTDVSDFFAGVNRNGGAPETFHMLCVFLGIDPAAVLERLRKKEAV